MSTSKNPRATRASLPAKQKQASPSEEYARATDKVAPKELTTKILSTTASPNKSPAPTRATPKPPARRSSSPAKKTQASPAKKAVPANDEAASKAVTTTTRSTRASPTKAPAPTRATSKASASNCATRKSASLAKSLLPSKVIAKRRHTRASPTKSLAPTRETPKASAKRSASPTKSLSPSKATKGVARAPSPSKSVPAKPRGRGRARGTPQPDDAADASGDVKQSIEFPPPKQRMSKSRSPARIQTRSHSESPAKPSQAKQQSPVLTSTRSRSRSPAKLSQAQRQSPAKSAVPPFVDEGQRAIYRQRSASPAKARQKQEKHSETTVEASRSPQRASGVHRANFAKPKPSASRPIRELFGGSEYQREIRALGPANADRIAIRASTERASMLAAAGSTGPESPGKTASHSARQAWLTAASLAADEDVPFLTETPSWQSNVRQKHAWGYTPLATTTENSSSDHLVGPPDTKGKRSLVRGRTYMCTENARPSNARPSNAAEYRKLAIARENSTSDLPVGPSGTKRKRALSPAKSRKRNETTANGHSYYHDDEDEDDEDDRYQAQDMIRPQSQVTADTGKRAISPMKKKSCKKSSKKQQSRNTEKTPKQRVHWEDEYDEETTSTQTTGDGELNNTSPFNNSRYKHLTDRRSPFSELQGAPELAKSFGSGERIAGTDNETSFSGLSPAPDTRKVQLEDLFPPLDTSAAKRLVNRQIHEEIMRSIEPMPKAASVSPGRLAQYLPWNYFSRGSTPLRRGPMKARNSREFTTD
ncbi:hypothetical protein LTR62_005301 [Meristemomyces frigidus]|uniref:Uncharacterized protein n=1 Tax=Meristemomyces frigidus TaxID=1508187 RepID=A0AAN7YFI3_9PEZI|nr:hypothetical protein LTR62_005301 [Meristemomyces frigidus]